MKKNQEGLLFCLFLAIALLGNGCAYMRARGNDALDIFDIGVTVSPHAQPDFAAYAGFINEFNLGYAKVDGTFYGLHNRQFGALDYENHSWGALVWGTSKHGAGAFNPNDPHQARRDQRELTERPEFGVGIVRNIYADKPLPFPQYFQCDKMLHLGWVGLVLNCRIGDVVDFILGWTTLDIMQDDQPIAPAEKKAVDELKASAQTK
jgi:hypothetical protein